MKNQNTNVGGELLFLLRQQRYLYHQLKLLTERQRKSAGTNSPEFLLEIISGRRKLVEKLHELNNKLRPIKANWQKLSSQIEPEHRIEAHEITNHVHSIIGQIMSAGPSEITQALPLEQDWKFDELLAENKSQ